MRVINWVARIERYFPFTELTALDQARMLQRKLAGGDNAAVGGGYVAYCDSYRFLQPAGAQAPTLIEEDNG